MPKWWALFWIERHTHTQSPGKHTYTHPYTAARAAVTPVIVLAARIIYPREMHAVRAFIIYKHTPQPGHPNTHTHSSAYIYIYSIIGIDCDTVIYCICRGLMVVHFCIYVYAIHARVFFIIIACAWAIHDWETRILANNECADYGIYI